ncbi:MAG: S41 family peptidase [Desulfobacteraceae bacterium]|jgi:carboxyl-terminal processing protease|nr:S41 family peptidase [Desulfobacteraceae bacterium]
MTVLRTRHWKLWMAVIAAVIFWTIGTGFDRQLAAENEETYEGLKLFSEVIELIQKNYVDEVDSKDLIEKAVQGMVRSLDPHSALLPPEAFEDLSIDTKGEFSGIGIHITMRDGFVTVISPIEGTPAYDAGIQAMDRIVRVDDKEVTELREAVNMMRGPKGSSVKVTIMREGVADPIEFNLVRDVIPIESVRASKLKPGYAYIRVTNFNSNTVDDLKAALKEIESDPQPLKGLIIDLRDNGGGLLDQSIKVADLFLDQGVILSIKGRQPGNVKEFSATPNDVVRDYPIVILINGGSASASEIVVGALQDHHRALVLGTTTFGKGSVQTVETLREGYGLKLTIARYYTPSGRSIQAKGIEPDIVVRKRFLDESELQNEEDARLKEKDLRNHLEAFPQQELESPPETQSDPEDEMQQQRLLEMQHGPLTPEKLRLDYQVQRALEILVSYDIFKNRT